MRAAGSSPSTDELVTLGAPVRLRDGSRVRIRQGHRSDRELLLRGFERLSPESRYRRFLVPVAELSDEMVRYLTEIDHHDHEAMIAIDEETGEGIGVARYVRNQDRPEVAELAVTVIDDWQAKGLGTLLVEVLSGRAREEGITAFSALMLARNQEMIDLLKRLDHVRIVDREVGTVEIEMPIPAIGLAPALKRLLQIAGRHDLVVLLAGRDARSRLARRSPRRAWRCAAGYAERPVRFEDRRGYNESLESDHALELARTLAHRIDAAAASLEVVSFPSYLFRGPAAGDDASIEELISDARDRVASIGDVEPHGAYGKRPRTGTVERDGRPAGGRLAGLRPRRPARAREHVSCAGEHRTLPAARAHPFHHRAPPRRCPRRPRPRGDLIDPSVETEEEPACSTT